MERTKLTKDLGVLSGRLLVFGGVYSNFQALTQMRLIAESENIAPSNIICTGDIVAYCAQPEECIVEIKDWGIHSIAGNVEIQLREGLDDCGCNFDEGTTCNILSNQWYPYAQKRLSKESIDWMHDLADFVDFTYAGKKFKVVHGSVLATAQYIFKSTNWLVKQDVFKQANADVILGGHCGLPFTDSQDDKLWLNAGVIGMPANDGTTDVWYAILDDAGGQLNYELHRMSYDHNLASQLMKVNRLPKQYAETLVTGIWDNCDVLPEVETGEQGRNIEF